MRQFLLASILIAVPVAGFATVELLLPTVPPSAAASVPAGLGDVSAYETIVTDTRALAKTGDFVAAEKRISDFETQWDAGEATLRPKAPEAWGNVDTKADESFSALRASQPDPKAVEETLAALSLALADPTGGAAPAGSVERIAGIAVTDKNGHAIPCETLLGRLRGALSDGSIVAAQQAEATALQVKATARCNADDDTRSNAFAAQALALGRN
jgi:hypothetical protein